MNRSKGKKRMSKRKSIAIYLFIISSGLFWSNISYAGMDLIETVLMQATGVLQKASDVVEKASLAIEEVTSGKILDEYYQEYQNLKGKLERAEQRFKNTQERANNFANRNAGVNEANQKEMDDYNAETSAIVSQVERSRQALLARGRISDNYKEQEDDENSDDETENDQEIKKDRNESLQTSISSSQPSGSSISATGASKTSAQQNDVSSGNSSTAKSELGSLQLSNYESTNSASVSKRKFISSDNNTATVEKTNVKK